MSALFLEARVVSCFLAVSFEAGLLPQPNVVFVSCLVAELVNVLFLKCFRCFFVCLTADKNSAVNSVVIKSWDKVIQPGKCEKAESGAFWEQLIDQSETEED